MPPGPASIPSVREVERGENNSPEKGWTGSCEGCQERCSPRPLRERKGSVLVFFELILMLKHVNDRPEGGGRDNVVAAVNSQLQLPLLR